MHQGLKMEAAASRMPAWPSRPWKLVGRERSTGMGFADDGSGDDTEAPVQHTACSLGPEKVTGIAGEGPHIVGL
jgi:hypothetical protein